MTREDLVRYILGPPRAMVLGDLYAGCWNHWPGFQYDTSFDEANAWEF